MKKHSACSMECQYSKDVGADPYYSCMGECQYRKHYPETEWPMKYRLIASALLILVIGVLYALFNKPAATSEETAAPTESAAPAASNNDSPSYSGFGK